MSRIHSSRCQSKTLKNNKEGNNYESLRHTYDDNKYASLTPNGRAGTQNNSDYENEPGQRVHRDRYYERLKVEDGDDGHFYDALRDDVGKDSFCLRWNFILTFVYFAHEISKYISDDMCMTVLHDYFS